MISTMLMLVAVSFVWIYPYVDRTQRIDDDYLGRMAKATLFIWFSLASKLIGHVN